MQASTVSTPITDRISTIFGAIELSQKTWLVTMHSPDRDKISRHKVQGGDHASLLALIDRVRDRAARTLGVAPAVVSCYEAGYDGFWLHRLLQAAGITNYVFDPSSIAVDQRARRVKTDRIDGEKMLRTLMAYLRGEPRVVRIVRVPAPEQEDARRDTRERDRLTKEQTAHTNRIKALLRLHGFAVGNPRRRDWLIWLAAQRDWQGQAVPPRILTEIEHEHARLMLVRKQLEALAPAPAAADLTPAAAEMARRSELLLRAQKSWPGVRDDADPRGVLQGLPQPARGCELFRAGPQSMAKRRNRSRPGDQQGGQSARPLLRGRAILAVAAASAGQRAQPMVPAAHAQCQQAHQAHRHCGLGAQVDGRALALPHNRSCARRGDAQVGGGAMI